MPIFSSPVVLLLSALALGMEEEVNGIHMNRLEQVESQNIERSEPQICKSSCMDSPHVTPVKTSLRAKTSSSLRNSVEDSAIRSLSDCKNGGVNALTSGRLLISDSGSSVSASPGHLKKNHKKVKKNHKKVKKNRGRDDYQESYNGNQVRSFRQSYPIFHDSPLYDGHHIPNGAHTGQPAHGFISYTSREHLSGPSAYPSFQSYPYSANQPSDPLILESQHYFPPMDHTLNRNRDPTNQHHPPSLEAIGRPVAAHDHAIGQHHRSAIRKEDIAVLGKRFPFLHEDIPHTINSLTHVQDAPSPFVSKVYSTVRLPDPPAGSPARGNGIDLAQTSPPPSTLPDALRTKINLSSKNKAQVRNAHFHRSKFSAHAKKLSSVHPPRTPYGQEVPTPKLQPFFPTDLGNSKNEPKSLPWNDMHQAKVETDFGSDREISASSRPFNEGIDTQNTLFLVPIKSIGDFDSFHPDSSHFTAQHDNIKLPRIFSSLPMVHGQPSSHALDHEIEPASDDFLSLSLGLSKH
uniref:AlNc14C77G5147 protein n=1 Tax=Albugo laibachii Nc14 TaxID=890382 RepID=F0WEU8_9STRA|nr:AlNc14C77G5147 [Albugo laibachii Nc14]|eukprot:CCA19730.1 AlNc14C77G5147 [Albugo laibachii Nc14]